jgi:hypothetical protein
LMIPGTCPARNYRFLWSAINRRKRVRIPHS